MDKRESLYSGYSSQSIDSKEIMYNDVDTYAKYFPKLDRIKRTYLK